MALTVTELYRWNMAYTSTAWVWIKVVGDTSFPASGYSITPATFGLNAFADTSDAQQQVAPALGPVGVWAESSSGGYAQLGSTGNLLFYAAGGTVLGTGSTAAGYTTILVGMGR